MPTENRSSNTEMVSVPRELTQMAADAIDDLLADGVSAVSAAAWVDVSQQLRAILVQPAEQHQGEPVAEFGADYIFNLRKQPNGERWPVGTKLYTNADPGEVERLRASEKALAIDLAKSLKQQCADIRTIDALRADLASVKAARDSFAQNAVDLRDQLAEQDAIFARILGKRDTCAASYWFEEIQALLSARAEPSAPVERDHEIPGTSFQRLNALANQGE